MALTTDIRAFEDFYLDPETGDLAMDASGRLVGVSGLDRIAQRIRLRLGIQVGEWFLDTALGIDWLGKILRKAPDLRQVRAVIAQGIKSVPEVLKLIDLAVDLDPATRQLTVTFTALTTEGPITDEVTTP